MEAGPRTRRPPADGRSAGQPAPRTRIKLPADPYTEQAPRGLAARLRGPLIVLGLVLALFAVIAIVNRGHHATAKTETAAGTASTTAAPTGSATPVTTPYTAGQASGSADGVPIGYPHTSAGAEAAAANYVVAFYSTNMVYPWARQKLVNAIADPAIASTLLGQFDATYSNIDTNYGLNSSGAAPAGQTFVMRTSPMGVSLVSQSGGTATVAVWIVSIVGLAGTNSTHAVTENWATITATLNWSHGDWKWYSVVVADGPAPLGGLQTPAPGQTLQAAVNKFGGLKYGR